MKGIFMIGQRLSSVLLILVMVLADVSLCYTTPANAVWVARTDNSICGAEQDGMVACGEQSDLRTEASDGRNEIRPISEATAEDCLSPGSTSSSAVYAASVEWDIEITNQDDQNDYPACVQSEGTYNITVDLRVNIPVGKAGKVGVYASTQIFCDPMPYTLRWLDPPTQEYWTGFGNGTHTAELSFVFSTPEVRRESWARIQLTAELSEGDEWRDRDYHIYNLTILPPTESAVDVKFTGTVESLEVFWGMVVIGAHIRIDEVTIEEPWSLLTANDTVYVGFESAPAVAEVLIGVGDKVEVYCDYHPDTLALIWRPRHYVTVTQAQAFPLAPVLVGLVVAAVVVYFLWWRRRLRR